MQFLKKIAIAMAKLMYRKFYNNPVISRFISNQFTRLYYQTPEPERTWHKTTWLGHNVLKSPLDLWNYQEILFDKKPDVIVECGTARGGSALYYASLFDVIGKGEIITIDITESNTRPEHKRITYLTGSSIDPKLVAQISDKVRDKVTMVILDSAHERDHVLEELRLYSGLVTKGQYCVVEDTCINGHPVAPQFGPGPWEAVMEFMEGNQEFQFDERDRKFLMTFNPRGYLLKVK